MAGRNRGRSHERRPIQQAAPLPTVGSISGLVFTKILYFYSGALLQAEAFIHKAILLRPYLSRSWDWLVVYQNAQALKDLRYIKSNYCDKMKFCQMLRPQNLKR